MQYENQNGPQPIIPRPVCVSEPKAATIVSGVSNTNNLIGECLNVLDQIVGVIKGSGPKCNETSGQSPNSLLDDIDILRNRSENLLKGLYQLKEYVS